ENAIAGKVGAGINPAAAAREVTIEMGGMESVKEQVREVGWETKLESFLQDVRFGLRMLRKNPSFTAIAVLALALGIGANTAMFSVIEAVLLRPLPYSNAGAIASVASAWDRNGTLTSFTCSPPDFFDWRDQNRSFASMFGYYIADMALTGQGEARRVRAVMATAGLFSTLQAEPALGREFSAQENRKGANHVVILTHALWQSAFGSAPDILGKTIQLDSEPYTVIGVMPADFRFPLVGSEALVPVGFAENVATQRGAHYLTVLGRLKPGVSLPQANDDLSVIMAQLRKLYPDKDGKWSVHADLWSAAMVSDIRPALLILLGAVALVALIACANISNLLLARATVRHRELAMRRALGAGRSRLIRQMLTEGLLLALLAGSASLLLAHWALTAIVRFGPADIPRLASVGLNGPVLAFATVTSILCALLFALLPALRSSALDSATLLRSSISPGREAGRLRGTLLVGEVALSMMLLAGAGLLVRSFAGLSALNPGFDPQNVLTMNIGVPDAHYKTSAAVQSYWDQAFTQLRTLPGVDSVAAVTPLPLSGDDFSSSFQILGRTVPEKDEPSAELRVASPDYFRTLSIALRQGRTFTEADRLGSARVALISETAARLFFPAGDAIGQQLKFGASGGYEKNQGQIVGIVGDVRHFGVDAPIPPIFYVPLAQAGLDSVSVVLRTRTLPASLAQSARKAIQSLDRDALVSEPVPMESLVSASLCQRRFYMMLLGGFAALALVLAAVGLYGVISYSVAQRTQEVGIRVALGASAGEVVSLVMREGLRLTATGLSIGLVFALILKSVLKGLLVGVSATDPATLAVTASVLLLVAVLATYIPARRAARINPTAALRFD
ncbi:MAG TPA: ABC transporter permease, partial [Bryobacteraceae bacterium]|nr:ABC transporter permease [Bryobacteraceae bacterium]